MNPSGATPLTPSQIGQKVSQFLDLTMNAPDGVDRHTFIAATVAARRTNLPAWILDKARKKYRSSCGLLRNADKFVWDLMQDGHSRSESVHASLEKLWLHLVARTLGRPMTPREHRRRWLASQKARWERFDLAGLSRP